MDRPHEKAFPGAGRSTRLVALSILFAILSCLVAVTTLAWRVVDASRDLRLHMAEDSSWVIAQMEVDHQRVLLAIHDLLTTAAAEDKSLPDLLLKFDIYFSRVQTVIAHTTRLQDFFTEHDAFTARLEIVRRNLASVTPLVDGLRPDDLTNLGQIDTLMTKIVPDIRFIVVTAVQASQQRAQTLRIQREAMLEQFLLAGVLATVLIFGLLAISAHFYRNSVLRSKMVERLDSNLRASFEAALDGVIVTDHEGRILLINSAAEALFGRPRTAVIGRGISVLFPPRVGRAKPMDERKLIQQLERRHRRRLRLQGRDGQMVPISVSALSDTGSSGQQIHVGFVRDISTNVMVERQRRQASQRANRDAAEKVRFLAATSHELRTPMQGVLAAIDLVLRQGPNPAVSSLMTIAQQSAVAALDQIDHVLEVAALDDVAQFERVNEAFSAEAISLELIAAAMRSWADAGLNIRLDLAGAITTEIIGKPRAFRQTLRNLISNAVKFGAGKPIILRLSSPMPHKLRVEVEDAGIGIDPADQVRIFDDFETLDRGYARVSGGIGIGLGIVRRAVRSMGGTVGVTSRLGKGSIFWFEIPTSPAPAQTALAAPDAPLRALVVDDLSVNRLLVQKMIHTLGHRADKAGDGMTAVRMASLQRYDMIFMDISMPGMDGIEATRQIRTEGASCHTTIIGFTANLQPADHSRALAAGMREILYKPVRPTDIERAMYDPTLPAPVTLRPQRSEGISDAVDLLANSLGVDRLRGVVREMIDSFHALLDETAGHTDLAELAGQAHKCAGAAAILGALPLHSAFCALETAALNNDTVNLAEHIRGCRTALSVSSGLIEARVDALSGWQAKTG
jgi:PAS domain S-box-containing protein